jgi:ribose-phosphate pyrophosphokinase
MSRNTHHTRVFGLGPARTIAEKVCQELGFIVSTYRQECFSDGEVKLVPEISVRDREVLIFSSLYSDPLRSVNDRLVELYLFICTVRDLGAKRITLLLPYLAYSRSDQRKSALDALNHRAVAKLFETAGANRLVTLDVHNVSAFENAHRIEVVHLEGAKIFAQYLTKSLNNATPVVLSPDIGGIKRAEVFRGEMESTLGAPVRSAFVEKFRTSEGIRGSRLVGEIKNLPIVIYDDMICSGSTILRAAGSSLNSGAGEITVLATHGVFAKGSQKLLESELIKKIVVTDSYPVSAEILNGEKLMILSCAPIFAEWVKVTYLCD